jgi:cephalosporin hydroxylase
MAYVEDSLDMPLRDVLAAMQERIQKRTTYFGVKAMKSPIDHWVYRELICEARPDFIVEIGNACGGSTLSLAHTCDLLGHGRVVAVDLSHAGIHESVRSHPRISFVEGDACSRFPEVMGIVDPGSKVLVIDDSSHTFANTLKVLWTYSPLLKVGDYFIVEDGICRHGLDVGPKPGPYEAVEAFVRENPDYAIDRDRESFLITWNPKGYLRRVF